MSCWSYNILFLFYYVVVYRSFLYDGDQCRYLQLITVILPMVITQHRHDQKSNP